MNDCTGLQNSLNLGDNHIEVIQVAYPAGPAFLNDVKVTLNKPAKALYVPSFNAQPPVVGVSFQPIGYQIKVAAPGNPLSAGMIKLNLNVSWQWENEFQVFYLSIASAAAAGVLTLLALNGLEFHGPQS